MLVGYLKVDRGWYCYIPLSREIHIGQRGKEHCPVSKEILFCMFWSLGDLITTYVSNLLKKDLHEVWLRFNRVLVEQQIYHKNVSYVEIMTSKSPRSDYGDVVDDIYGCSCPEEVCT